MARAVLKQRAMKKQSRKLVLSRETLMPLSSHELVDVNGGTVSASVAVTVKYCSKAVAAATKAVCPKVVEAGKWAASAVSAGILGNRADDAVVSKCQ